MEKYSERRYFSSVKKYTKALLEAFSNVKYWTYESSEKGAIEKEFDVPVTFANYEKAQVLEDLNEKQMQKGYHSVLPRIVVAFDGISKNAERQTQKYQRFSPKGIDLPEDIDYSWNSQTYDFHFTLLIQTRGLTVASMITEDILAKFNPSMNLQIKEFPIFENTTETQILIEDPVFEILDQQEANETDIVNVSFGVTVRGNIYSPLQISGRIEKVKIVTEVWDRLTEEANLSWYYEGKPDKNGHILPRSEIIRHFDGTIPFDKRAEQTEQKVQRDRPDYSLPILD